VLERRRSEGRQTPRSGRRARANGPGARPDGGGPRRYRAIWISDTHLGSRGCQAAQLLGFLEHHACDRLYLVGDVIDGWSLRRSWYWNEEHNRIVRDVLKKSSSGTRVAYICGNHDEFLRPYLGLTFGGVQILNEDVHVTADGRRLLVVHGDRFDACIRHARWLSLLGARAYAVCLVLNTWLNRVRRRFGYGYWSLSAYLKQKVKNAVSYVASFEEALLAEARRRGFDGVVCGHIHKAELRKAGGMLYANDGDWVESCTALVEDDAGRLAIVRWSERRARAALQA
jgi:UDP-2,3-diacylglucosamine pyrophosphatase LpxH